jgi:hypothetical protein
VSCDTDDNHITFQNNSLKQFANNRLQAVPEPVGYEVAPANTANNSSRNDVSSANAMLLRLRGNGSAGNGLVLPPAVDDRTYGSDDEDYDDNDR